MSKHTLYTICLAILAAIVTVILLFHLSQLVVHGQVMLDNLIQNPSFEELDPNTDHPTHWVNGHSKNTSWLIVPDGTNYGYVLSSDTAPMYQDITYTLGSSYVLTFWSGKHNNNESSVELQYLDKQGNTIDSVTHTITHIVDTDKHLGGQYELKLPPNSDAYTVRVTITASNGWGKVDAVYLYELAPKGLSDTDEPQKLFLPMLQK